MKDKKNALKPITAILLVTIVTMMIASVANSEEGNTLIADSGNNRVIEINSAGTIVWSYSTGLAFPRDVERLPNGNTLIADSGNDRVIEINSAGTIVWSYSDCGAAKAARLPNGNTLIAWGYPENRVIEVNTGGDIVWGCTTGLLYPSDAERLPNGNTLIADTDHSRVIEVDTDGNIVWEYADGLSHPHDVDGLPNGNTLISSSGNNRVIEVDTDGNIVWEYAQVHPEEADRLPNGNTLISTGLGNRVIEVNNVGDIVWQYTGLNDVNDAERMVVQEENVPPEVGNIDAPLDPAEVNTVVDASAEFTDQNTTDSHTATWDWGDGSFGTIDPATSPVSGSHTYTVAGVYTVKLTVTDNDGASDSSEFRYVVVYDPEGGFVTGGGWIDSPEGAYTPDPSLTGEANFGFVSKYKKGATTPTGQTEFQFKAGDMNFHSDFYDWLVVAGANAKYKGVGTINGIGNYGFMLTAKDADITPPTDDVDEFRIKIWDEGNNDALVYDNRMGESDDSYAGTEISGGSIKVHEAKAAPMDDPLPEDTCALAPFPNPSNPEVWIPYQLSADSQVVIHIYDVQGHLLRKLDFGYKPAGFYATKERAAYWDGRNEAGEPVASGIYFYTIRAGEFTATKKMIVAR